MLKKFKKMFEKKSRGNSSMTFNQLLEMASSRGWGNFTNYLAYDFYENNSALSNVINKRAEAIANLNLVMMDDDGNILTEHPLLDYLKNPSPDMTQDQFLKEASKSIDLTGQLFIYMEGQSNFEPINSFIVPGFAPMYYKNAGTGLIDYFQVSRNMFYDGMFRRQVEKGVARYMSNDNMRELYYFVNNLSKDSVTSLSKVKAIWDELGQLSNSNTHNLKLLENGLRLSGIFSAEEMDEEARERFEADIKNFYTGSENSGRVFLAVGTSTNFKELGQNNKDMDFLNLKTEVKNVIYSAFDIPLPLVNPEHMTLSNFDSAKVSFYEDSILPHAKTIFEALTKAFKSRFKDLDKWHLAYDPQSIETLKLRRNQELKLLSELNVTTINEMRNELGFEAINGGDELLQPMSMIPLSSVGISEEKFVEAGKKSGQFTEEELKHIYASYKEKASRSRAKA